MALPGTCVDGEVGTRNEQAEERGHVHQAAASKCLPRTDKLQGLHNPAESTKTDKLRTDPAKSVQIHWHQLWVLYKAGYIHEGCYIINDKIVCLSIYLRYEYIKHTHICINDKTKWSGGTS